MKILKENSFMRDELVKEPEVTAVVDPTYKKAVDDFDKTKKTLDKTMKGKENREKPILGKKEDKINLEESLFEDVEEVIKESKKINEGFSSDDYFDIRDNVAERVKIVVEEDGEDVDDAIRDVVGEYLSSDEIAKIVLEFGETESLEDIFYNKVYGDFAADVKDAIKSLSESCKKDKKNISEALVEIDDDYLLEVLMRRLNDYWNPTREVANLYEKMYQNYIDNGVFEGQTINLSEIVDNDWVNYCDVISENDDYFEECKKAFAEGGYEISDENGRYIGYIEAVDDEENPTKFLIRVG